MSRRSEQRRAAVFALYQHDLTGRPISETLDRSAGEFTRALAHAAEAAARQGAFWEMHDSLFADQGHLDVPHLWERARALGLDLERFDADRRADAVAERVQRDFTSGVRAGVVTTPTLFVDGHPYAGIPGAELLSKLGG